MINISISFLAYQYLVFFSGVFSGLMFHILLKKQKTLAAYTSLAACSVVLPVLLFFIGSLLSR